jgi:RecA/RadA recombinase
MRSPTHIAALDYAQRGWSVFPVEQPVLGDRESGKKPLTRNGKDDATTDTATIDAWWAQHPNASVAIALDKSGLVALDVDVGLDSQGNAKPGRKSLEEFDAHLTPTLTAITGGGGLHAIYDAAGAPIHALKLREGLDIIGRGYIVAAPSPHYTGGQYRWNDVRAIAPVPDILRAAVASKRSAPAKVQSIRQPIGEGGRNVGLYKLGCALYDNGIGAEALARALDAENKERAGLPDAELAVIINNVLKNTPSRDVANSAIVEREIHQMFAPRSRAQRILDVAHEKSPPVRVLKTGIEELDTLTRGGLRTRRVMGVVGPPSMGKSAFVTSIAMNVQKEIPVLHFSAELPRKEAQIRYAAPIVGFPWSDGLEGRIPDDVIEKAVAPLNIWIIGCDDYDRVDPIGSLRTEAIKIRELTGQSPLIIVDYVQLLARGTTDQVRHKVGELTMALRMLSQELDCPVIAVFTTSRGWYGHSKEIERVRAANDPVAYLGTAKEAGEIEYDCGTLIFLDLDMLVDGPVKPCRGAIARCRDGKIGFVGLRANLATGLWVGDPAAAAEIASEERAERRDADKLGKVCERLLETIQKMPGRPWREIKVACKGDFRLVDAARAKLIENGRLEMAVENYFDALHRTKTRDVLRVKIDEGITQLAPDVVPEE